MRTLLFILAATLCSAAFAWAAEPSTQPSTFATDTSLHNLKNQTITPLTLPADHRAVVLLFISTDCPIANGYAPLIADLCRSFAPERIDFFAVYEDSPLTTTAAITHHDAYGYPCDALLDPQHELAHITGATVTPEAIVVGNGGTLLYRGRIDDQYVSVGRKRFSATTHELKEVLSQISQDQPVTVDSNPAVGCLIP